MSRSYRKHPTRKDNNPFNENQANRLVRRHKGYLPDGSHYKKLYPQYDICDWRFTYLTADGYVRQAREYEAGGGTVDQTDEELRLEWYRTFKRK